MNEKTESPEYIEVSKKYTVSPIQTINKEVMDDFGINKEKETVNIDLKIPKNFKTLYITGESGSGKSTILKDAFKETTYDNDEFLNTPLIEMGLDVKKTLKVLNMFGLGDASLFALKPTQLSDSQRKRAEIVRMVLDGNKIIVIDEFLSTLDRLTAKSISYNIKKNFDFLGIKLVAATAHTDLEEYLKPDVIVKGKSFPSRFTVVEREDNEYTDNPITNKVTLRKASKEEYREEVLGEIHYKGKYSGGKQEYFFAELSESVIGVLVTNNLISSNTRRISRVVVHPTFRGVGIAQMLIKYCINSTDSKIDTLAAMAKYNPVFEKSGMHRVGDVKVKPPTGFKKNLEEFEFNISLWGDLRYCVDFSSDKYFREFVSKFADKTNKIIQPGGKSISVEERARMIKENPQTCGRVVWNFRERIMAKYVSE